MRSPWFSFLWAAELPLSRLTNITLQYKVLFYTKMIERVAPLSRCPSGGSVKAPMKQQRRLARRVFKGFAGLAMLGVVGVAALLVSLWLEHRTEVTLPTPTGGFAVGRALYDWADEETLDTLAPGPGIKRELLVWIWYPAVAGPSAAIDDYLPAPSRTAVERQT